MLFQQRFNRNKIKNWKLHSSGASAQLLLHQILIMMLIITWYGDWKKEFKTNKQKKQTNKPEEDWPFHGSLSFAEMDVLGRTDPMRMRCSYWAVDWSLIGLVTSSSSTFRRSVAGNSSMSSIIFDNYGYYIMCNNKSVTHWIGWPIRTGSCADAAGAVSHAQMIIFPIRITPAARMLHNNHTISSSNTRSIANICIR